MTWYDGLAKPSWTPQPGTIGLIWTCLYPVIAVTFGFIFLQAARNAWKARRGAAAEASHPAPRPSVTGWTALPFAINLVANLLFTPIQFGLRNLPLASVDILIVLSTIVWMIVTTWPRHRWVALAQVPYLLWVTTATVLQLSMAVMNW